MNRSTTIIGLRIVAVIAALVFGLYACVCVLLFVFQRSLLYHPQPPVRAPGFEQLVLQRRDAQVVVLAHTGLASSIVIYLGGNAEAVGHTAPELRAAFPGASVYLMNYRG